MKCKCGKPQRIVVKGEQLCWDCFDEQEKARKESATFDGTVWVFGS